MPVICFLTVLILIFSCKQKPQIDTPDPMIVYEVFIQSFCDSNHDGIGDIPGLISKLDYIRDLGANAIWIMPVHPSPSYHKYDITDYYAIHPDYGTMADMDRLINECHHRHMKLIMDLVINHTSSEHPWFIASASSTDNPYHDYYVWRDYQSVQDEINKKTTTFDSDNLTQWHKWKDAEDHYYGFFWKGMPDLDFDNPAVREEVFKIGKFWLNKGIDGFRMDAARHIFPDDRFDDTVTFWEEFRSQMESVKPDVMLVGEVWSDPNQLIKLFKGLPSLFNFELTKSIPQSINADNPYIFIDAYSHIDSIYRTSPVPFIDAVLLSNHDMNRIRSSLGGNITKAKVAASLLLTLPGVPYIYYGEEIGMLGMKPDENNREPFLWGEKDLPDTHWMIPKYSVAPEVTPLQSQKDDDNSIYNYYKKWIQLRLAHPEMAESKLDFIKMESPTILAYTLTGATVKFLVMHNFSTQSIDVPVPAGAIILSEKIERMENKFSLRAYSSVLLKIN